MAFGNQFKGKYGWSSTKPTAAQKLQKSLYSPLPDPSKLLVGQNDTPQTPNYVFTKGMPVEQQTTTPNDLIPTQQTQSPTPPPIAAPPPPVVKPEYTADPNLSALATQSTTPENVGNILGNLSPELQEQIKKNILGMASGSMFDANKALSDQAFAAQAQNIRAQGGAFNAPNIGQGAANMGQQAIEQGVMEQLTNKKLQEDVARNQLMQQGTGFGTQLAQQNAANAMQAAQLASGEKQQALGIMSNEKMTTDKNFLTEKLAQDSNYLQQQGLDADKAKTFGYTDANGNHVKGTMEMQLDQMNAAMSSQAGESFSSYVSANLSADINDPAIQQLGQKLWESFGSTGQAPKWWVDQRISAVRDPALTNPIVGTQNLLQEAVDAGVIQQEQLDGFMDEFSKQMLNISGATTSDAGTNATTNTSEVQKLLSDEEKFDEFSTSLPDSLQDPNLEPSDWVDLGKPNAEEFNTWYTKKGGKDYLSLKKAIPTINANLADTIAWKKGEGKYAGQKDNDRYNPENDRVLREKLSKGVGEDEISKQLVAVHNILGKYSYSESSLTKKERAKMIKDGYSEKRIDDMLAFAKMMNPRETGGRIAFGFEMDRDRKKGTHKLKNIIYN